MQKEPSALACDIANPFPPDLWGYVHGFVHKLGIQSKPRGYAPGNNIDSLCFSRVTAGAGHHQEGAGVRDV